MTTTVLAQLSILGVCLLFVWLLAKNNFKAAVRLDGRLLGPVNKLPGWWGVILRPFSEAFRPRTLGLIMVVILIVFVQTSDHSNALLAGLAVLGMGLMELLKIMFKRPRPLNEFVKIHKIKSLSFPSGHAGSGLLFFLSLAVLAAAPPLTTLILICVGLLIGFSRIYLRVHHPSDVLGGWLIAVAWLQISKLIVG